MLKKQNVRRDISFLRSAWKLSSSDLEDLQQQKLKSLIKHSFSSSEFYRGRMLDLGMTPEDIQTAEDLKKLPPLERNDVPELMRSATSPDRSTAKGTSSGTTGIPISYYKDSATQSMGKASLYFGRMVNGWNPGDRTVNIWGNPKTVNTLWTRPSSRINAFIQNEVRIPACGLMSDADMRQAINRIISSRAEYVSGYTNSIRSIAGVLATLGVSLDVKRVFTTAETLLEEDRDLIERHLGPVSDMYGCSEINGIAFQCPDCGLYHTMDPHVIVEFDQCHGRHYSLLVTDLDNRVMPFIRYRVGDIVETDIDKKACPSGTNWSSFKRVLGRMSNIIEIAGSYINPITYFGDSLGRLLSSVFHRHIPYQTVWNGDAFITTLYSTPVPEDNVTASLNAEMDRRLSAFGVDHEFRFSLSSPELSHSGKATFFRNTAAE